ncbi:MAG: WYL domain-containing protein [Lachnospiraceae bacterium]|nr:WYL domain-containing protein [Lachnospiraceae bacterium]
MAKTSGYKLKILYIAKLLNEHSDENHLVTVSDITAYLNDAGLNAERKGIYDDIECLKRYGMDIQSVKGKNGGYFVASRDFELAELKILVDAVQASRCVTEKKSRELIQKLETLANKHDAVKLHRQVVVAERNKSTNEQVYYSIDAIYEAMAANKKITFLYCNWDAKKELVPRKNGEVYEVSPWLLSWEDENYYLTAYDSESEIMKYYRVDKMMKIDTLNEAREGRELYEKIDIAAVSKRTFGMFSGENRKVTFTGPEDMAGIIIDRFGTDVWMHPDGEGRIRVTADIVVSNQFYGWLTGIGDRLKIEAPEDVKEGYVSYLKKIMSIY